MPMPKSVGTAVKKSTQSHHRVLKERVVRTFDFPQSAPALVDELFLVEGKMHRAKAKLDNVAKHRLNLFMSFVVILNILAMALEIELSYGEEASNESKFDFWWYVELIFTITFFLEICVRVVWEGNQWRMSSWNIFDLFCLVPSLVSVIAPVIGSASKMELLNVLRVLKLARLVRSLKTAKNCEELYVVFMAWWKAMVGITYIVILISVGLFLFSLIAAEIIGADPELRDTWLGERTAYQVFGSITRSLYTLFVMMTLEGFEQKTRPLVERKPALLVFFFSFVMFFTFGLVNMLVAQVVERTIAESQKLHSENALSGIVFPISKLKEIFDALDSDNNGRIERSEFESRVTNSEDIQQRLHDIGFPLCDMRDFFKIVDQNGDGILEEHEFYIGCLKLYASVTEEVLELAIHGSVCALDHRVANIVETQAKLGEQMRAVMDMMRQMFDAGSCSPPKPIPPMTPRFEVANQTPGQLPVVEDFNESASCNDVERPVVEVFNTSASCSDVERMNQEMNTIADHTKAQINSMWLDLQWKHTSAHEKSERAIQLVGDQLMAEIRSIGQALRLELRTCWEAATAHEKIENGRSILRDVETHAFAEGVGASASQHDVRKSKDGIIQKGAESTRENGQATLRSYLSLYEVLQANQAHKSEVLVGV